jgi:hypothetical protein
VKLYSIALFLGLSNYVLKGEFKKPCTLGVLSSYSNKFSIQGGQTWFTPFSLTLAGSLMTVTRYSRVNLQQTK